MSLRGDALDIIARVVPSDYGDARFSAIIGDMYRESPTSGTTCGYLTSFLLYELGCRAPEIVNRNGDGLRYHIGENISRLVGGAKKLGAWRTGSAGIRPGDCYFISLGPPLTEHVGVLKQERGSRWITADAGQRNAGGHQAARFVERAFDGRTLWTPNGPKPVVGYVDIEALPYTARRASSAMNSILLAALAVGGLLYLMEG